MNAVTLWPLLIKQERLSKFLTIAIPDLIAKNLSQQEYFAKDGRNWDLFFGAIVRNPWLARNVWDFENPMEGWGSVLEQSRRLQELSVQALAGAQAQVAFASTKISGLLNDLQRSSLLPLT
ncbi:hypothetical protein V6N13_008960 [Hibiscus sabdariffa]